MSQESVSSALGRGFSLASLYRWEAGVDLPSFDKMARLARHYGASLDWLAGSTSCRDVFYHGHIVVDRDALQQIGELVDQGRSLDDVPAELLRPPGLNCAWPIPKNPMMLDQSAAESVEHRLHAMFEKLRARTTFSA
jgi:transcriptional regulator with XRE-family HTH domain